MIIQLCQKPTLIDFLQVCDQAPDDEREQYEAFNGKKFDPQFVAASLVFAPGPSWVLYSDNTPIAVAGFERVRQGVWQDWMVSTPTAWDAAHWRHTTRQVRRVMDAMLKSEAHRLQCISLRSRIQAHRWYKSIGLVNPVLLEAYGVEGQDALMFSRVRQAEK